MCIYLPYKTFQKLSLTLCWFECLSCKFCIIYSFLLFEPRLLTSIINTFSHFHFWVCPHEPLTFFFLTYYLSTYWPEYWISTRRLTHFSLSFVGLYAWALNFFCRSHYIIQPLIDLNIEWVLAHSLLPLPFLSAGWVNGYFSRNGIFCVNGTHSLPLMDFFNRPYFSFFFLSLAFSSSLPPTLILSIWRNEKKIEV